MFKIPDYLYGDNSIYQWIVELFAERNPLLSELYIYCADNLLHPSYNIEPSIELEAAKRFKNDLIIIFGNDLDATKKLHLTSSGRGYYTDISITEEVLDYFPDLKEVYFREVFNVMFQIGKYSHVKKAFEGLTGNKPMCKKGCIPDSLVSDFANRYPPLPEEEECVQPINNSNIKI